MKIKSLFFLLGASAFAVGTAVAQDKALYDKYCKTCHAEDGSGKKDGNWVKVAKTLKLKDPAVLDLLRPEAKDTAKMDDAAMENLILKGKDKMKPLEAKITADEAKLLVKYVRTLQTKK